MHLEDRRLTRSKEPRLSATGQTLSTDGQMPFVISGKVPAPVVGLTYAQRRLVELQQSGLLAQRLPLVTRDTRRVFEGMVNGPSNIIRP